MRGRWVKWTAVPVLLATTACYTYAPVSQPAPAPGEAPVRVRAELTELGSAQLRNYLGPGVDWLEGTLVTADEQTVTLAVTMTSGRRGESYWAGETATLPRDAIRSMQRRELSRSRTLLASLGIVAGALAAAQLLGDGGAQGGIRVPDDIKK